MDSESRIQSEFYQWWQNNYCLKGMLGDCASIPNEGDRGKNRNLDSTGRKAGFPDFLCIYGAKACLIEFKAVGGDPSPKQKERIEHLQSIGFPVTVCDNIDDAKKFVGKVFCLEIVL
jgi:hypothetical protein